jgi:hypothetical protein
VTAVEGFTETKQRFELTLDTVTGVRAFKQDKLGRLTGVTYNRVFRPGVNRSMCDDQKHRSGEHIADCSCGYYAYYSESAKPSFYGGTVGGIIRGSGKIVVGDKGFRAEKAELLALFPIARKTMRDPFRFFFPSYTWHVNRAARGAKWLETLSVAHFVFLAAQLLGGTGVAIWQFGWLGLLNLLVVLVQVPFFFELVVRAEAVENHSYAIGTRRLSSFERRYLNKQLHSPEDTRSALATLCWGAPKDLVERDRMAELAELYPDVKIYESREAAEAEIPITKASDLIKPHVKLTPQNTDNFWDLEA